MHQLRTYLATYHDFSADDWQRIEDTFVPKVYRKGEFLNRTGQTDRYVWFIERGVVRLYEETADATEHTFYFMSAGQFVADLDSFHGQMPSVGNIQAVTECQTRAIDYDEFGQLAGQIPDWNSMIQRITERVLLEKLHKRSPGDRREKPSSPESYDLAKAEDLWTTSEQLVGETNLTAIRTR